MVSGLQAMILEDVCAERDRQDEKWGPDRELPWTLWATILGEEYGEVNQAILSRDVAHTRLELVQVAAVAFAMIEALDREEEITW